MTNPAIVFVGQNQLELRDEPLQPLQPNQVRVQATASLISTGTEMICYGRKFAPGTHWDEWVKYPFSPGYSLAGRVTEVGAEVSTLHEGDRVAVRTAHRKFSTTTEDQCIPIPDGVSDEDATWFGLGKIVQVGVRRAQHALGDAVVVIGLGLLGQLVVQYTRLMGARQVIAVDTAEPRLRLAAAHGATLTLALPVNEARDAVFQATDGLGADVVYDVTGHPAVFAGALPLARNFGKIVLLGDAGNPSEQRLTSDLIRRGLTITSAHDIYPPSEPTPENYWTSRHIQQLFLTYVERGDLRVSDLVTHRYVPADAEKAYAMLDTDRMNAMGVLFDWRNA